MEWSIPLSKHILIIACAAAALGGCAGQDPLDVLAGAAENMARAACEDASNCRNRCPSGEEAEGPLYACTETP